jgi:pseudaminic acid biosynthesis-associated methylase
MVDSSFSTEQETFWRGEFGDAYTERNQGDAIESTNLRFWERIISRTGSIDSCFEIGCNRGLNLDAIKTLLPDCQTAGLEINSHAARVCSGKGHQVFEESILAHPQPANISIAMADLSIACGVLIHINPDSLATAYDLLYTISAKFILISEYFSPVPVSIPYRGHANRLFKRDFASELWSRYPGLRLIDYGFVWRRDPVAPLDDINWFIFEK